MSRLSDRALQSLHRLFFGVDLNQSAIDSANELPSNLFALGKFPKPINTAQPPIRVEPTLLLTLPKEDLMSSLPEIPCGICRKPVDLQTDLWADENGKAAHADCYFERIASARLAQAWVNRFSLSPNPPVCIHFTG